MFGRVTNNERNDGCGATAMSDSDAKRQQVEGTASLEEAEDRPEDKQRRHRESKPTRVWQQREQQRAEPPLTERPVVMAFDLCAGVFESADRTERPRGTRSRTPCSQGTHRSG
jgi:hypothetical protein